MKKTKKKSNCTKDYDWKEDEQEEFWESEAEFEDMEDSEDDYPDLDTRIAEVNAECEEWEKEIFED